MKFLHKNISFYLFLIFSLITFVVPKTYDCSSQTEKQSHYNHIEVRIKKNGLAHAETVINPFNSSRYFGFVCLWHSMGFIFLHTQTQS